MSGGDPMTLRDYQSRALEAVEAIHAAATDPKGRRVVCVVPTGGGKSVIGREWARRQVERGRRGLVLAHRIELLSQMAGHLSAVGVGSSIIAPGYPSNPYAPVQIASLDTLVARGEVPQADWILPDECHHLAAETWRPVIEAQPEAEVMGLTATPQRGDGKPLGDIFGSMVIGAQYSELIRAGHLTRCRVYRPDRFLGANKRQPGGGFQAPGATGFAQKPLDGWMAHARGKRGFVFCRSVKDAEQLARDLCAAGERAANVDGKMAASERARRMAAFASGEINILTNVFVLTEGVDVPDAEVCMLACACSNAANYLQRVGRVLRVSPGKREAMLIDLPGVSWEHGLPTSDRDYALDGRAIRVAGLSVRNCPECGFTQESVLRQCGSCGFQFPRRVWTGPKIWNVELLEYFEGVGDLATAPASLKRSEWDRLLMVCGEKGFGPGFAVREYEKMFSEKPGASWLREFTDDARVRELRRLLGVQKARGHKVGWISVQYKETFGAFPSRAMREAAGVPVPDADAWRGARFG